MAIWKNCLRLQVRLSYLNFVNWLPVERALRDDEEVSRHLSFSFPWIRHNVLLWWTEDCEMSWSGWFLFQQRIGQEVSSSSLGICAFYLDFVTPLRRLIRFEDCDLKDYLFEGVFCRRENTYRLNVFSIPGFKPWCLPALDNLANNWNFKFLSRTSTKSLQYTNHQVYYND